MSPTFLITVRLLQTCSWRLLRNKYLCCLHLLHKWDVYLKEEWQGDFLDQLTCASSKGSVLELCLILVETL